MSRLPGHLYFWVLLAIVAGGVLGYIDPATAVPLKPPVTASAPSSSC
jgi:aerobic C4-dicarboxylate transport protein